MGIDYSGNMIIGETAENIQEQLSKIEEENEVQVINDDDDQEFDIREWLDDKGLDTCNQYFDCDVCDTVIGFIIPDVPVKDIDEKWLAEVREKAEKFKKIFGVEARLIGTQDIY